MNFSIFAGDGTLGLDNARVVVLRGTTTCGPLWSPNLFPIASYIQTGLENRGFSVNGPVRITNVDWVNISGYRINLEIELNVYNSYTADQARINAQQAIEDYRANFGIDKPFSNTSLSVAYDAGITVDGGNLATVNVYGGGTPAGSPPSQYNLNSGAAIPGTASTGNSSASSSFWSALGLTAAPSATVLILGIGVIAIIALKK